MASVTAHNLSEIGDVAGSLRPFLEDCWRAWKVSIGNPADAFERLSAGMCGFTSSFMAGVLNDMVGGEWTLAGGRPLSGGGVRSACGAQAGHFWTVSADGVIVDLTADQFGLPTVVVTTERDPRYQQTFTREEIEAHLPKVEGIAAEWREAAEDQGLAPVSYRFAA